MDLEDKMKKVSENRYPNSATLFKFCKEALALKYDGNVKVIDQDVGAILGYDPADCSHWKKGKKNIRSLGSLKGLADHLKIDERLLIDVASGRMGLEEAIFEFKGYGEFRLEGASLDGLKKEYFKNPSHWQQGGTVKSFEEIFEIRTEQVATIAAKIIERGGFTEAPVYINEIVKQFPQISLSEWENLDTTFKVTRNSDQSTGQIRTELVVQRGEMRPYVRFLLAKEIFMHLCVAQDELVRGLAEAPQEVRNVQANVFASYLLIPDVLLKNEVLKVDMALDIVTQLTKSFWVSKSLMNQRLRDYLAKSPMF